MIKRINRAIVGFYPMAFRRRYGDELNQLIEDRPGGIAMTIDLFRGATVAHLRPQAELSNQLDPAIRIRLGLGGVLACWVAFASTGLGFYKSTEGSDFVAANSRHPVLGGSYSLIQIVAAIGSIAVIVGVLPLALMALRRAFRQRGGLALLMSIPFIAVAAFIGLTVGLVVVANSSAGAPTTLGSAAFIGWVCTGLTIAAGCVLVARKVLFKLPVDGARLANSVWFAAIATGGMIAIGIAAAVYSVALSISAPALASATDGPLQANSVSVSIYIQTLIMLGCAVLAVVSTRRARRAAVQLNSRLTAS
jgi:hypothetical protein